MRGKSKSLPKYAKHRASGQAVVRLNCKDVYLGPHGTKTSKLEYDRVIGEWLANGRQLPSESTETLAVKDLIARYWAHCKTYYVKNGKQTDEVGSIKIAMRDTRKLYGQTPVNEFGPLALVAIRNAMIARLYKTIETTKPLIQEPSSCWPPIPNPVVVGEASFDLFFDVRIEQLETLKQTAKRIRTLSKTTATTLSTAAIWIAANFTLRAIGTRTASLRRSAAAR